MKTMAESLIKVVLLCLVLKSLVTVTAKGSKLIQGRWDLLLDNAGVSAQHMQLLYTNKVLMYDQTQAGPSNITLNDPQCRNFTPSSVPQQCWAHAVEFDIATNSVRPLHLHTDTWCSSGALFSNGTLVSTGGFYDSENKTRYYTPCSDGSCDWIEDGTPNLSARRWYASNQILPDNRVIVLGGEFSMSYEFIPKRPGEGKYDLPFLAMTTEWTYVGEYNTLYPFIHISSDGNLFIFANKDSILFDYINNQVLRTFPTLPGGPRNYPASGSSIMFPLNFADNYKRVEVMICGGGQQGSHAKAKNGTFVEGLNSCGRMEITSPNPQWAMEEMPSPRVMGDMIILPTGEILIINGAQKGCAGYQLARDPVLSPWLYRAHKPLGSRFIVLGATKTPRMYHSTAILLPDTRILVAGSNSWYGYNFSDLAYSKTELSLEAYSPYYLHSRYDGARPSIVSVNVSEIKYGSIFTISFNVSRATIDTHLRFHVYAPAYNTHSFSMAQLMVMLPPVSTIKRGDDGLHSVNLRAPPNPVVAPSGYYLLTVVNGHIPSKSLWIRFF